MADFILGLPGENARVDPQTRLSSPNSLTARPYRSSIAHAFPGTEFYDYAKVNGFITNESHVR